MVLDVELIFSEMITALSPSIYLSLVLLGRTISCFPMYYPLIYFKGIDNRYDLKNPQGCIVLPIASRDALGLPTAV